VRKELEEQIEALEREHDGDALVDEIERLASGLPAPERELLQDLLVERSGVTAYALERRTTEPRFAWFRRAPREPGDTRHSRQPRPGPVRPSPMKPEGIDGPPEPKRE
jgi:hypothetical protein